jgi:hypothetical protein
MSDQYSDVDENGSPLAIVRSFETLSQLSRFGQEERESELAGSRVVFTYDREDAEWSALYAEDTERSEHWLDDLAPRVDLACALEGIDGDIEVGSTWELSTDFLSDVLYPGGQRIWVEPSEAVGTPLQAIFLRIRRVATIQRQSELEGKITATLTKVAEVEDVRLASIEVEVRVEGDFDVVEELEGQSRRRGARSSYSNGTLKQSLEGELMILWNLTANRAESIEGELSGDLELDVAWSMGGSQSEPGFIFH